MECLSCPRGAPRSRRIKPPPLQERLQGPRIDYQQPIFRTTAALERLATTQFQELHGFRYCSMLEGSTFDMLAHVRPWNAVAASRKPEEVVRLLDSAAQQAKEQLTQAKRAAQGLAFREEDLKRMVCYFAAEGANSLVSLTDERFLRRLKPQAYFPMLPSLTANPVPEGKRQHFRHAFLVSVMGDMSGYTKLLERLDDGESLILLSPYGERRQGCANWVAQRAAKKGSSSNSSTRADANPVPDILVQQGQLAHFDNDRIFRIHHLLSGLWQLLDAGDWDHVTLVDGNRLHPNLEREVQALLASSSPKPSTAAPGIRHQAVLGFKDDNDAHFRAAANLGRIHVCDAAGRFEDQVDLNTQYWPQPEFRMCYQQSHSMLLPRGLVAATRTDPRVLLQLAYVELTYAPMDNFFCSVALSLHEHANVTNVDLQS